LRLTNEFHFDIILDEEIEPEEISIPPMLLQPFAENSIWHGLIPKQGEKKLTIEFRLKDDNTLVCRIEDNGIGRAAAQIIKEEKQASSPVNKSRVCHWCITGWLSWRGSMVKALR
jgi:sensor histidine kinase YesM